MFFNQLLQNPIVHHSQQLLKNTVISTGLMFSLAYNPHPALALSLSPIYLELKADKTQTTGILKVSNTSDKPLRVRVSATAFSYDEQGNFKRLESGSKEDLTSYMRYSPKEVTIPPKSTNNIRLAAILPPSLPDGEYRVAIFVNSLQEINNETTNYRVNFTTSMGSAIYVRKGNIHPNLNVDKAHFNTEKSELRLTISNQGQATARPKITWKLTQNNKEIIKGEGGGSFLPNKTMSVILKPNTKEKMILNAGNYQLSGEAVWNDDGMKSLPFALDLVIK